MNTDSLTLNHSTETEHSLLRALLDERERLRDMTWLAGKVDYSPSHLHRVVHEGRAISPELAARLATLFGVDAERFLPPTATPGAE